MKNYARLLKTTNQSEVNNLLDKGWELLAIENNGEIVSFGCKRPKRFRVRYKLQNFSG